MSKDKTYVSRSASCPKLAANDRLPPHFHHTFGVGCAICARALKYKRIGSSLNQSLESPAYVVLRGASAHESTSIVLIKLTVAFYFVFRLPHRFDQQAHLHTCQRRARGRRRDLRCGGRRQSRKGAARQRLSMPRSGDGRRRRDGRRGDGD